MYEILLTRDYMEYLGVDDQKLDWKNRTEMSYVTSIKVLGQMVTNFLSKDLKMYGQLCNAFPDPRMMVGFYQLGDADWVKMVSPLLFTYIQTNSMIKVPVRLFEEYMKPNGDPQMSWKVLDSSFKSKDVSLKTLSDGAATISEDELSYEIRLLAPWEISVFNCLKKQQLLPLKERAYLKKFIFQIHGGGFIATTSHIHQTYLRRVAQDAKCVIFSVDYPLAPTQKFSTIIDCIFKSYLFVKCLVERVCEFEEDDYEMIFMGDSAGGNLSLALVSWLIFSGQKVPRSIFLAYPAMNLSKESFTPSLLVSFDDYLLNFSMIMLCMGCYLTESNHPEKDYMISPLYTPDSILEKFPPTWILACERDPLHDDSFRFSLRMASAYQKT